MLQSVMRGVSIYGSGGSVAAYGEQSAYAWKEKMRGAGKGRS